MREKKDSVLSQLGEVVKECREEAGSRQGEAESQQRDSTQRIAPVSSESWRVSTGLFQALNHDERLTTNRLWRKRRRPRLFPLPLPPAVACSTCLLLLISRSSTTRRPSSKPLLRALHLPQLRRRLRRSFLPSLTERENTPLPEDDFRFVLVCLRCARVEVHGEKFLRGQGVQVGEAEVERPGFGTRVRIKNTHHARASQASQQRRRERKRVKRRRERSRGSADSSRSARSTWRGRQEVATTCARTKESQASVSRREEGVSAWLGLLNDEERKRHAFPVRRDRRSNDATDRTRENKYSEGSEDSGGESDVYAAILPC